MRVTISVEDNEALEIAKIYTKPFDEVTALEKEKYEKFTHKVGVAVVRLMTFDVLK